MATPHPRAVVLIADDSRDTREVYAQYLKHSGFTTLTAADGDAAVHIARDVLPDVVVMDLSMPFVDGVTAIQRLRQHPQTRDVPVILLTGYPAAAVERGAIEAGADVFLTKPCLPEHLEQHVRELLTRPRGR